jgi:hypothetical protein
MTYQIMHRGQFVSTKGVLWTVELLKDQETAPASVGELTFPAKEPLVIEWKETSKEDVLCGSQATLKIVSPGDGTYQGVYSVAVGKWAMRVWRMTEAEFVNAVKNGLTATFYGSLWWCGTLDTEFYEEPYAFGSDYEVSLTFSDFGILDRFKYLLTGVQTLNDILTAGLAKIGLTDLYGTLTVNTDYVSTYMSDGTTKVTASAGVAISSENFTDEDGETSTYKDVLEAMLQPMGLRMVQRAGVIWIYDLNGVVASAPRRAISWASTDQTLGVDKLIQNLKVTFSPYSSATVLSDGIGFTDKTDKGLAANTTVYWPTRLPVEMYSILKDYGSDNVASGYVDFAIFLSWKNVSTKLTIPGISDAYVPTDGTTWGKYAKIVSYLSGEDATCMCAWMMLGAAKNSSSNRTAKTVQPWIRWIGTPGTASDGSDRAAMTGAFGIQGYSQKVLFTTKAIYIPKVADTTKTYYLRLMQEMMVDARYNPFEEASSDNDDTGNTAMKEYVSFAFVPVKIELAGDDGKTYHWVNSSIAGSPTYPTSLAKSILKNGAQGWQEGAAAYGDAWLSWYDNSDREHTSALTGWKENKPCIGIYNHDLPDSIKDVKGQYMEYPPVGGQLTVTVYRDLRTYNADEIFETGDYYDLGKRHDSDKDLVWKSHDVTDSIRWWLFKSPAIKVVNADYGLTDAESDDVVYESTIQSQASDDMELETTCGTMMSPVPTAKGSYLDKDSIQQTVFVRGSRKTQIEELLTGTIYSQFHSRKRKLSGTTDIDAGALALLTDANMGSDVALLAVSESDDLRDDTEQLEAIETEQDKYTKNGE